MKRTASARCRATLMPSILMAGAGGSAAGSLTIGVRAEHDATTSRHGGHRAEQTSDHEFPQSPAEAAATLIR